MNRCDNAWLIILPVKECFPQILQEGESYRAAPNLESPDPDRDCELLESLLYELIVLRQGILSAFIRRHTRLSPVDSRHEKEWLEQLGNGGTVRIETFRHGESDVGLVFEITDVNSTGKIEVEITPSLSFLRQEWEREFSTDLKGEEQEEKSRKDLLTQSFCDRVCAALPGAVWLPVNNIEASTPYLERSGETE